MNPSPPRAPGGQCAPLWGLRRPPPRPAGAGNAPEGPSESGVDAKAQGAAPALALAPPGLRVLEVARGGQICECDMGHVPQSLGGLRGEGRRALTLRKAQSRRVPLRVCLQPRVLSPWGLGARGGHTFFRARHLAEAAPSGCKVAPGEPDPKASATTPRRMCPASGEQGEQLCSGGGGPHQPQVVLLPFAEGPLGRKQHSGQSSGGGGGPGTRSGDMVQ